jgi:hypothetical protein
MSLELSYSDPKITAKTNFFETAVNLYNSNIDVTIPMKDFCYLVEYVLENTDLFENDPRLKLVEKIKNFKVIPGYNHGASRIMIEENSVPPSKETNNRFKILKMTE